MSAARKTLGARGEAVAAGRIEAQSWPILARNWRCRFGEIDIVARDGDTLAIIEVRTKSTARFGQPEESIGAQKRRRLVRLGQIYVQEVGWPGAWRIDVIAVSMTRSGDVERYVHLQNAVGPS